MPVKSQPPATSPAQRLEQSVRHELHKIIHSKAFRQGERLQRFLTFVVNEALEGRGPQLKEYPIGVDVFGKETSFDPRMDPIVRVQARRLRMRLQTYYREEGHSDELVIELPKGGYAPTFRKVEVIPQRRNLSPVLISRNTVTVQPLQDCTPDNSLTYFTTGLASEIINLLSQLQSVIVIEHDAERPEGVAPAAVIVSGTVRKADSTFRITLRLTDAMRGSVIWSESIDRRDADLFALQDEAAQLVTDALKAKLIGDDGRTSTRSANLAANNMYLQGRYQIGQRTESGLRKAVEYFGKAIEEDPGFSAAYAGMADSQLLMMNYGVAAPADLWTKTASNAAHAVLLDDESSEAHTALAHVKAIQDWDWAGSEQEFRKAIRLDPRNSLVHHWYAMSCLAPTGALDEALQEMQIAQSLDPVSSIIQRDVAQIFHFRREYDRALEQCDYVIEQNPHFSPAYWTLGLVQEQRGELEESIAALQRAIELSPPNPRVMGALARTYVISGRKGEGLRLLDQLNEMSTQRYISPFELSLIYFSLNRIDEGFAQLDLAFQHRCFELITLRSDPRFSTVSNDERYQRLFSRLGLP